MTLENPHFQQKIHLHGGLSSQSREFLVQLDGDPKTLVCLVGDLIISTMVDQHQTTIWDEMF